MELDSAAANEINRLDHTSLRELTTKLPLLFAKILDPDQEAQLVYSYVVSIHRGPLFLRHSKSMRPPSSRFEEFSPAKDREWKTLSPQAADSVGLGKPPWMPVWCPQ